MRFCLGLLLIVSLAARPGRAAQAQTDIVAILAPGEGQVAAGLVTISGVASSAQFERYEVEFGYEPNPTDTWFPLQDPVLTQQPGGTLAQWDTLGLGIADGTYVLRLRLYHTDGTFAEAFAHNIQLRNGTSPVLATGAPGSETQAAATPAPTATATSVQVQLPPTSTPRPAQPTSTPLPAGGPIGPPNDGVTGPTFDLPSFARAFVSGIGWTAGAFALVGLYAAVRPRLRPYVWRMLRRLAKSR
jgi:hypothetical protein